MLQTLKLTKFLLVEEYSTSRYHGIETMVTSLSMNPILPLILTIFDAGIHPSVDQNAKFLPELTFDFLLEVSKMLKECFM